MPEVPRNSRKRATIAGQRGSPMTADQGLPIISHAIQLAIAPVSLLTGIAGLLGVMANRLARVIDRARQLEQFWPTLHEEDRKAAREELDNLERRRHLVSWSINFCTSAALIVCLVIVTLFLEEFFSRNFRWLAGMLCGSAMIALICGFLLFF